VDEDDGVYGFLDTLEAGSARLVQFVDTPLAADLRITRSDVTASRQGESEALREYRFTAGEAIEVSAVFYNMGTQSPGGIGTTLVDMTSGDTLDTAEIDLPGLSTAGYACAADTAVYSWVTDSDDIGTHVLEVSAEPWSGEPDTLDDSARALFLIEPRDYATEETEDPWDMSETAVSPPAWKTDDVAGLSGWTGTYTDSIGGMFEGMVDDGHLGDNRMSLRLDAPLDAGFYDRLGLAVFVERESELWLGWETDESVEDSVLVETIDAGWSEVERVDPGGGLPDDTLEVLWLGFRPDGGADMRVRVGRVELTE
jgi:hypothetical protein